MSKEKKVLFIEAGFALVIAVLFLLVCTKSSPLYPMNDWVDVDCIFTVGKSMTEGLVPYKDIFDHKGPFLYFIFAIASFMSSSSFMGLWIFEIISVAGMLFFSIQSAKLFMKNKWVIYTTLPIVVLIVLTTRAFTHGGSTEELALLPLSYSLFYFLRLMRDVKLSKAEHILTGVCLGALFWMKFTMVGFYIGAYAVLIVYRVYKKDMDGCIRDILFNIAGFALISAPILVYFILNGALKDLWEVYFYDNIFLYGEDATLADKLGNVKTRVANMTYYNRELIIPIYIAAAVYLFKNRAKESLLIIASFATAIFGIYIGGYLTYYALILSVFSFLSIGITDECYSLIVREDKPKNKKSQPDDWYLCILPFISTAVCFCLCFSLSSNVYLMEYDKEDMPQYKFAEIINSVDDPTLLNYRFLDGGFYFAADVTPTNRFFYRSNLVAPGLDEDQQQTIRDKKVDFVVTRGDQPSEFVLACGYEYVTKEHFYFEGSQRTYYLYERDNLR